MKIPNKFNRLGIDSGHREQPLTFTAVQPDSSLKLTANGNPAVSGLQYRTADSSRWRAYTIDDVISLQNIGDYVQFRNTGNSLSTSANDYVQFAMTGKISSSGNIQALLNYSDSCSDYCYRNLFYGCTSLTTAPDLPAETMGIRCYYQMFYRCLSLTTAPDLPAMTLKSYCYYNMFAFCRSLSAPPALPAMNLSVGCYQSMFYGCTSLTTAPVLSAVSLSNSCYYQMFSECTALKTVPLLSAPALTNYCYFQMFKGCSALDSVTVNFTNWNIANATTDWLYNVSAAGTFCKPDDLPETRGANYIPDNWIVIIKD